MSGARLNLVRCDDLIASESLGVSSTNEIDYRHDEVELLDGNGEPCAMVALSDWVNSDVSYRYTNGGVGISPRRARHRIGMVVDSLDNAARARLERWQRDRALVWYCPGMGRHTSFAYRPVAGNGTTFADGSTTLTDLTGKWALSSAATDEQCSVWDPEARVMREFSGANARRVVPSPFGAIQAFEDSGENRHSPGYPITATEGHDDNVISGDSGWMKSGLTGDITFAMSFVVFPISGVFSKALRVTTTHAATRTRSIRAGAQWDSGDPEYQGYSWTGACQATMSIWLRGRFSEGATLSFYQSGGSTDSVVLSDLDLDDWTKISLSVYSADWSTGLPDIAINLGTGATAGSADFEIGPMTVLHQASAFMQESPEWTEWDEAFVASHVSTADYSFPYAGSAIVAFYAQPGATYGRHSLLGTATGQGRLYIHEGSLRWYRTSSSYLSASVTVVEGAVNTVAAVWDSAGDYRLYFNGSLVDTATDAEREITVTTSDTLYVGYGSGYAAWPFGIISARVDARAYTSAEIAEIDAALRDPVSALLSAQARGRKYRIVSIPSTPRNQEGGTAWTGELLLEEAEYDSNLADITTAEVI